jgi:putative DNA primase/helicase
MLKIGRTEKILPTGGGAEKFRPSTTTAQTRCVASIKSEPLRWLWPGRFPLGKLSLLIGDPGLGKSLVTLDLAARVSRGLAFADSAACEFGSVILLSAEDDPADTIRPRLEAAGAHLENVIILDAVRVALAHGGMGVKEFNLETDVLALEDAIASYPGTRAVIVDPISAYMGTVDGHSNVGVRGMLRPLADLASRCRVAVIAVSHLSKARQAAVRSAIGSIAFAAAARAVWAVVKDLDDPERRLFLPVKANLAADAGGLSFKVDAVNGVPRVSWDPGAVTVDVNSILSDDGQGEERGARQQAQEWLRETLEDGPIAVVELRKAANAAGLAWRTLERAKAAIGAKAERHGFQGSYSWKLPTSAKPGNDRHTSEWRSLGDLAVVELKALENVYQAKPIDCATCGQVFASALELSRHLPDHNGAVKQI